MVKQRREGSTGVPEDPADMHPALRAVIALGLGVALGTLAALFIPRRRKVS